MQVEERLARLREAHGHDRWASDAPATGSDPSGAVTVVVDATGWVVDVQVAPYEQAPRADVLSLAVLQAYVAADAARLRAAAVAAGRDVDEEAARPGRVRRPVARARGPQELPPGRATGLVDPEGPPPPVLPAERVLEVPGSDEAAHATVLVSGSGALRRVVLDDPWLERARPERVTAALRAAMAQAYGRLT